MNRLAHSSGFMLMLFKPAKCNPIRNGPSLANILSGQKNNQFRQKKSLLRIFAPSRWTSCQQTLCWNLPISISASGFYKKTCRSWSRRAIYIKYKGQLIMRKLNSNEKFLIGFTIVLILAIAFSWKDFSSRVKNAFSKQQIEQIDQEKWKSVHSLLISIGLSSVRERYKNVFA